MQYDAFISYRHAETDMYVAKKIHKGLETFKVPKSVAKNGGKASIKRVFRDQEELPIGSDLNDNISAAISDSEFLLVVCSPRTPESYWVRKEITTFIECHDREHVLAILVEGEPGESFPEEILKDDEGKAVEPLAADVRGANKRQIKRKLKTELIRLAAPILHCSYDDLRQRHRERKMRRVIAWVATVGCIVAGLGISFGIYNARMADQIRNNYHAKQVSQAKYLADTSLSLLESGNRRDAALVALSALPTFEDSQNDMPYVPEAEYALSKALYMYQVSDDFTMDNVLNHELPVKQFVYDKDGIYITSVDKGDNIYVWDADRAKRLLTVPPQCDEEFGRSESVLYANVFTDRLVYVTKSGIFSRSLADSSVNSVLPDQSIGCCKACIQENLLVTVQQDSLVVYDANDLSVNYDYHNGSYLAGKVAVSPNGRYIAVDAPASDGVSKARLMICDIAGDSITYFRANADYMLDFTIDDDGAVYVESTARSNMFVNYANDLTVYVEKSDASEWAEDAKASEEDESTETAEVSESDEASETAEVSESDEASETAEAPESTEMSGVVEIQTNSSVFLSDNTIIRSTKLGDDTKFVEIAMGETLYAYDGDLNSLSKSYLQDSIANFATTANGYNIVTTKRGKAVVTNPATGTVFWDTYVDSGRNASDLIIRNGIYVFGSTDSTLLTVMKSHMSEDAKVIREFEADERIKDCLISQNHKIYGVETYLSGGAYAVYFMDAETDEQVGCYYFDNATDDTDAGNDKYSDDIFPVWLGFIDDSRFVAAKTSGKQCDVYVMNVTVPEDCGHFSCNAILSDKPSVSPNGKYMVIYSREENCFTVANLDTLETKTITDIPTDSIDSWIVNNEGTTVYAVGYTDGMFALDVESGQADTSFPSECRVTLSNEVSHMCMSSDQTSICVLCADGYMRLVDTQTHEITDQIRALFMSHAFAAFTQGDRQVVLQGDDGCTRIYDLDKKDFVYVDDNGSDAVTAVRTEEDLLILVGQSDMQILTKEGYALKTDVSGGKLYIPQAKRFISCAGNTLYGFEYASTEEVIAKAYEEFAGESLSDEDCVKYHVE